MPSQLRMLLATIFVFGNPTNPKELYINFEQALSEYYMNTFGAETATQLTLRDIEEHLLQFGTSCMAFGLSTPRFMHNENTLIEERLTHEESVHLLATLNDEQRFAFNTILESIYGTGGGRFFLSGQSVNKQRRKTCTSLFLIVPLSQTSQLTLANQGILIAINNKIFEFSI